MRRALLASLMVLLAHGARAQDGMSFTLGRFETSKACGAPCAEFIVAKGMITHLSAVHFMLARTLSGERDLPVILESPGGYVMGAVGLARLWRKLGVSAVVALAVPTCAHEGKDAPPCPAVDRNDGVRSFSLGFSAYCASACPVLLAGATRRAAARGAKIGVHQPAVPTDSTLGRVISSLGVKDDEAQRSSIETISRAFKEFGVDTSLAERYGGTPHSDVDWLTLAEARNYGLINADPRDLARNPRMDSFLRALHP